MSEQNGEKKPLLPRTLPRWWRVLPSLFILMMISNIDSLILNDFIEYRYSNYYNVNSSSTSNAREICLNTSYISHNSTNLKSTTTSKYPMSTTMSWNDVIQASTARLNVFISLAATLPSIMTSIILGSNCDRIGRKPLIVLPFIGKTLRYSFLTAVAYFNLSNTFIIIAVMCDGLFGTGSLNILSSFAYATDCTNEKTRTLAITIIDVCIACSKLLPLLTIGIYLQHPHFTQSMMFTFFLSLAGFLFSIFLQPESNLNVQHLNIFQQLAKVKLRSVTKVFRVFFVKRQEHKQRSLLLLVGAHLTSVIMLMGYSAVYYLYLYGAPFCLDSFGVSLISVAQTVTTIVLTVPYTLTIAKRTDHLVLPMLGCLAYIAHLVIFGLARHIWMLYLGVCIASSFYVLTPIMRSRITKLVEPTEYAVVFILAGVVESGGFYATSAIANEIYQVSITFFPGLVYFVFSVVGAIAILLLLILYILERPSSIVKTTSSVND